MKQKKWTLESPIYVHGKKHFCPKCHRLLTVKRVQKTVNSKSEEAKNFDFSLAGGDGFMLENADFSFEVFYCPFCGKEITIREMKQHEKGNK